jgi:hypothetical protein
MRPPTKARTQWHLGAIVQQPAPECHTANSGAAVRLFIRPSRTGPSETAASHAD